MPIPNNQSSNEQRRGTLWKTYLFGITFVAVLRCVLFSLYIHFYINHFGWAPIFQSVFSFPFLTLLRDGIIPNFVPNFYCIVADGVLWGCVLMVALNLYQSRFGRSIVGVR